MSKKKNMLDEISLNFRKQLYANLDDGKSLQEEILSEGTIKLNLGDVYNTLLVKVPTQSHFKLIQKENNQQIAIAPEDVELFIGALKRIK